MAAPDALALAESDHVTPLFCPSFCTVAKKLCVPAPACRVAAAGETVMAIAAEAVTVIVATADLVLSATDVALTVTPAAALPGAVYVTTPPDGPEVADKVPHVVPLHP